MRHTLGLGKRVSFEGDPTVYITADYDKVHVCDKDCDIDHDCYEEPYIVVKKEIRTAFPISKLKHIFDQTTGYGREAVDNDKKIIP